MWLHPEMRTLADIPRHWSQHSPEKVALRTGDHTVSYRELEDLSNQLARAMIRAGAQRGDNVCFIGKNVPEFWLAWFAASKAGCAFVPLRRCTSHELSELLSDAGP